MRAVVKSADESGGGRSRIGRPVTFSVAETGRMDRTASRPK